MELSTKSTSSTLRITAPTKSLNHVDGIDEADARDTDAGRKGRAEARGKPRIENDEEAAVVVAADQPAEGLPQPQPHHHVLHRRRRRRLRGGPVRGWWACPTAPGRARSAAANRPAHRRRRAPHRCRAGRHRARRGTCRPACPYPSDRHAGHRAAGPRGPSGTIRPLVHGPQPRMAVNRPSAAAAGGEEQLAIGGGELVHVLAVDVVDDDDAADCRVIEGRVDELARFTG